MALSAHICSLSDQPPLAMRRDESSNEMYIDYMTPVDGNTNLNHNGPKNVRALSRQDESLQNVAAVVRLCPCSQDVHNPRYCLIEHDVCGMSKGNVLLCWKTSQKRVIGSCAPFVLFWIPIVILILGVTSRGRLARLYILRTICRESAEAQLERLLRDHPDRVETMIRNYERRMARARRTTRVAEDSGPSDPHVPVDDDLPHEASRPGVGGKSYLVLKTKMLSTRTTLEEEEEVQSCPICLGSLEEGMRIGSLACHHEFHVDCLKLWLKRRNHCPLCHGKVAELRVSASESSSSADAEP